MWVGFFKVKVKSVLFGSSCCQWCVQDEMDGSLKQGLKTDKSNRWGRGGVNRINTIGSIKKGKEETNKFTEEWKKLTSKYYACMYSCSLLTLSKHVHNQGKVLNDHFKLNLKSNLGWKWTNSHPTQGFLYCFYKKENNLKEYCEAQPEWCSTFARAKAFVCFKDLHWNI